MKFVIDDPMPVLRQHAEARVNVYFDRISAASIQRDLEHHVKRQAAAVVATKNGSPSQSFADAAAVEGQDIAIFAEVILSKPDEMMQRAIDRRKAVLSVRNAKNPSEIDELLKSLIER